VTITVEQVERARSESYWIGVIMGFLGGMIVAPQLLYWLGAIR
jgi:ABC-type transporter Mla maintaining outer membrane lipid asymmetry permease subunit MlaE